jgi:hypothetical protein
VRGTDCIGSCKSNRSRGPQRPLSTQKTVTL